MRIRTKQQFEELMAKAVQMQPVTFSIDGETVHTIYGKTVFSTDGEFCSCEEYNHFTEVLADFHEAYFHFFLNLK